jgi:hypothetical protein
VLIIGLRWEKAMYDRVILCAYRAFSLESLSHHCGDFASFLVARANHE